MKSGSSVTTNVLANDVCENPNCTLSNPTIVTQPAHGTVTVNPDGTLTYTPAAGFTGTDVLTYQVCDNSVNPAVCKTATVTYTVQPATAAPTTTAADDASTTNSNSPVSGNVLANDGSTNPNAVLTVAPQNTTIPGKGTIVMNADGSFTFTPTGGFVGTVDIPYTVCDNANPANCSTATLHIVVEPAPTVIAPDFNNGLINKPIAGSLATNDVVAGGGTYGTPVAATSNPTGATFTVNPDGSYSFTGTQPGVYTYNVPVCPAGQTTNCPLSPVTITVVDPTAANVAPAVNPDIATVKSGSSVTTNVLANDVCENPNCTLSNPTIVTQPAHGTVTVNPDGTLTYTPAAGFTGTDVLTYQVCDNSVNPAVCKSTTVTYTVQPATAAPTTTAADDAASTKGNVPATGNVLRNDASTDPNAVLTVTPQSTTIPGKGTIVMNADGSYTFTPAPGFTGTVNIPYTVCDNANPANCSTATLHVVVEPPVDLVGDINATNINVPVNGNVSTNDSAPGSVVYGTPVASANNPSGATLTMNPDGTYSFTATTPGKYVYDVPNCLPGQTTGCPTTPLVITVKDPSATNNLPVVNPDIATVRAGTSVTTNVLANDKCTNQGCSLNPASVAITAQPAHGTVTVNPDGTLTYTPAAGFTGTDVLTYKVCDNMTPANCQTATVTYTVVPANSVLTTAADDYVTTKGTGIATGNVLGNDASTNSAATLHVSATAAVPASTGTLVMNANGSYVFTPASGFTGTLDVAYTVCDNATPANCTEATLHITVDPAPTATDDNIPGATNGVYTTNILVNDQIQPGAGISITRQTGAGAGTAQGTVTFDPLTGAMVYVPSPLDGNTVTVGYTVCDNNYNPAQCADATVTIQVCDPANPAMDCDGDGVTNGQEILDHTDPADPCSLVAGSQTVAPKGIWLTADCDGDGVTNGQEVIDGTNPTDPCDYNVASKTLAPSAAWLALDCDGDGTPNATDPQPLNFCVGGTGAIPALGSATYDKFFRNADCDGDGISNHMETNTSGLALDFDGDGIPNYLDGDSDNDGIPDAVEQNRDSDGDGYADYQDLDSDNDGISDKVEAGASPTMPVDSDGDGKPNYLDLDSDNDGILDSVEAIDVFAANRDDNYDGKVDKNGVFIDTNNNGWADISEGDLPVDTDHDGIPDYLDLDSDNDCIPDAVEFTRDVDGDNRPNYRDTDSDGDGIPDNIEAGSCSHPIDTDGDGIPDFLDTDSDNDGIPDAIEAGKNPATPVDTDGDGIPDYRDLDSDNDGIPDALEAGKDPKNPVDTDGDGTPDFQDLDSDNDGIPDAIEAGKDPKNPVDTDGDGIPDFRDLDSDNDGIPDAIEAGKDPKNPVDTDGDGIPDFRDLDSDNDGIPDALEAGKDPKNPVDTDGDGIPDFRDVDSDNDGITDAFEAGANPKNPVDTDGDGIPDFRDLDSDNDGISDKIEGIVDTDKDGLPDFRDLDSDGDTYPDKVEGNVDTDKDGIPDFRDLDSDGDVIPDKLENDIDYGGMPDCDGDGIDNRIDPDVCPTFATQGISPNNDGINDVLIIPGIKSYKNHLTIFNRWGNVVWEQENYQNSWGGETNQGDTVLSTDLKLPDGTYYYVIDFYGVKPNIGTYVYINRQAK
ncbi:Ig-like domain-containing protein [Sandaracinomonas limnophila]|uniref:Ig-like domain-containing protein n=1 Tax=Sandaracinomonas limnophila TaxID=1862386 RepID=UPI001EEEBE29|nr:Ig-like domain-containing protein [Sandaracinomonas limnophila]